MALIIGIVLIASCDTMMQKYDAGQIEARDLERSDLRALFLGKMTYFYRSEGEAMAPTIQGPEHTLLVRKLALPSKLGVSVGDVLVFKDPSASNKLLVRRLSALEGEAIVSPKKKNKLSVLGKGKCWVVADNKDLTAKYYLERMTYLYRTDGQEMYPTLGGPMQTLLVRKLPSPVATSSNHLVRRLAAVGGDFMESSDDKGESFPLENKQCWVLSDNDDMTAEEAHDSRTFGPVPISDLVGRVIYGLQSPFDHNPIENSEKSMEEDEAILDVELDVNEMVASSFSYSMKAA
ncbi:hypothetical protein Droror1_Dr00000945 [Drosera rotundifolia]